MQIRHNVMMIIAAVLVLGLAPMAQAASTDSPDNERLAEVKQYAGDKVERFRYAHLLGYEVLSDTAVLIRTRIDEAYLMKLRRPCPMLNSTLSIGLKHTISRTFQLPFDTVVVDGTKCFVDWMRPVDYAAMSAADESSPQQDS